MKLWKVQFEDFKSICEGTLDIERGITTLVGINESGKSNALYAIEKADKKKKLENYDIRRNSDKVYQATASPRLTLFFDLSDAESAVLSNLFGVKVSNLSKIVISKEGEKYSLDYPAIDYDKSSLAKPINLEVDTASLRTAEAQLAQINTDLSAKRKELAMATVDVQKETLAVAIKKLEDKIPTLIEAKKNAEAVIEVEKVKRKKDRESAVRISLVDKLVKEYLPKVLFFDSVGIENFYLPTDGRVEIDKLVASPGKYKQVVNLLALGGITDFEILKPSVDPRKNGLRKQKLNQASTKINTELLRKHWPLEDVEFHLSTDETNILSINLREKGDDTIFVPGDRSRGLQWSVAFNIYFLSESRGGELRNSILLIDEPGVFLHIDAQKKLLEETFPAILNGNNQIIYTTHLPYLIHPKYPERIRILEKKTRGGETHIGNKAWSEGRVGEIPEPVKTALGTKWTEWFGNDNNNCIVEGPSDQVILRALISKIGDDYNFFPAYGKNSIPSALALAKLDQKNSIGIIDNDLSKDEIDEMNAKLSLVNIHVDTVIDISKLSGESGVSTIEDIVPEGIYRDAVCKVYKHQLLQFDENFKEEDIPIGYPRVANFEKFYQGKSKQKGCAFKKMEVARAVSDAVVSLGIPASNNPKWTLVRKIARNVESLMLKRLLLKKIPSGDDKPSTTSK